MKKELLKSLIENGVITVAALAEEKSYVLIITTVGQQFVVPMITTGSKKIAYISPEYGEDIYFMIDEIINSINDFDAYNIPRFSPFKGEPKEHSKIIKSFLVAQKLDLETGFEPDSLQATLEREGYEYNIQTSVYTKAYDFSEQRKDPEAADSVIKNHAEVEAKGGKYEDLPEDLKAAYKSIMIGGSSDPYAIILQGPTGTGKSFGCKILADHFQAPIMTLNISEGTTVEQLEGDLRYLEGKGGEIGFVPGPFTKAYMNGGFIVLDEINSASPNTLNVIHGYIDGNTKVSPTTYSSKYFERNKNFVVFMTMNPGYGETNTLTPAMKNRCKIVDVPKWTEDFFAEKVNEISKKRGYELSKNFGKELYKFANFIEEEAHSTKFHSNAIFSIRNALGLIDVICVEPQTKEQFAALININYINVLGSDQDNAAKLEAFKQSSLLKDRINTLYKLYGYTPNIVTVVGTTLEDLIKETEASKTEKSKSEDSMEDSAEELKKTFRDRFEL